MSAAIALFSLYCFEAFVSVISHGKPRSNHNAAAALTHLAVMGFLFYQAGLFK